VIHEPHLEEPAVSTTGRGRGIDERESPLAPPIPSFASLRAPRRSSPAMDLLAPPPVAELPLPPVPPPVRELPGTAAQQAPAPRPAEWSDLLRFGACVASAALRLPVELVREPARRLLRLLGE
jgi:hypothetical protein